VDTSSSLQHCGACGNECPNGDACISGHCTPGNAGGSANGGSSGSSAGSASGAGGSAAQAGNGAGGSSAAGAAGVPVLGGAGGAGGSSGSSGASSGPPNGTPGVVVATDDAGTLGCVALCALVEHADDSDLTDDWAYEGFPCVLADSPTGTRNTACVTGSPLPTVDRSGLPGVVVDSDGDMMPDCVALCEPGAMPSSTDSADWGWEYQASCIIRDTPTAKCNQGCTTGQALPDPNLVQRPGVVDSSDTCVATCACTSVGADPAYPDWGWEFQTQCLVANSPTWTDKPACTTHDDAALVPPAIAGATHDGFYTENGRLYDAKGNEFVMRGVNNPHVWADPGGQFRAYQALDVIASYQANAVRVVWETNVEGGTPALLRRILYRIVELKMVPIVELHDVTGGTANADLMNMAAYYTGPEVKAVLDDFRAYALVNIANEWSGSDYQNAYQAAIGTLRTAGLNHTLVIDAGGFGQDIGTITSNASALLAADTLHNLLFSVHMYSQYGSAAAVDAALDNPAFGTTIPLIVGEFGWRLQGTSVAWQEITKKCGEHRLGYLAWSWSGNDTKTAELNMVNDWGGTLTPSWGQPVVVSDPNSIQKTAMPASIFQ